MNRGRADGKRQGGDATVPGQPFWLAPALVVALLLSSMVFTLLPSPAMAATPVIDLEMEDGYNTPFIIQDLKPGDMGSKVVMLRNVGNIDGQIAMWVSGIEESDYADDGAHLDDFLRFEVSAPELSSNILMPSSIRAFPTSSLGADYIWVLNVRAGEAVQIVWYWEFEENYQSQNTAQGDGLSFTINYLLGDMPPPSLGMSWLEVDVLGLVTTALLDAEGRTMDQVIALDAAKTVSIQIPDGALCLSENGKRVQRISISELSSGLSMASGQAQIGPMHVVSALTSEGEQAQTFLATCAELRVNYDPALLPSITRTIGLYMYLGGSSWSPLTTSIDSPSYIGQCAGMINRSGQVAVIATFDPQQSAYFLPSDLSIKPSAQAWWDPIVFVTRVGDMIKVSVILTNIGEVQGVKNITLAINGRTVSSEQVVLGPLERREVTFTVNGLEAGDYDIEVSGLNGHVAVGTHVNWWLILTFICLSFGAVVGFAYSARRWKEMRRRLNWLQDNVMDVESKLLESEMAIVSMREKQRPEVADAVIQDRAAPSPPEPVPGPKATGLSASGTRPDGTHMAQEPSVPIAPIAPAKEQQILAVPLPPAIVRFDQVPVEAADAALVQALQQEEDLNARKVRIAKDFIMATIREKGQLTIDVVPKGHSAEIAMKALSQLVEEGRIVASQQEHRVVFVPRP